MSFVDRQNANATKGAVHGSLLTIAALCGIYNAAAYWTRRERHLMVNACIYVGLVAFESYQIATHCERHQS